MDHSQNRIIHISVCGVSVQLNENLFTKLRHILLLLPLLLFEFLLGHTESVPLFRHRTMSSARMVFIFFPDYFWLLYSVVKCLLHFANERCEFSFSVLKCCFITAYCISVSITYFFFNLPILFNVLLLRV